MFGLAQLPSYLDTVLFFSTALRNLTLGLMHFGTGVLQLSGALLLLGLVSLSLVLLIGGVVRGVKAFMAAPARPTRSKKQPGTGQTTPTRHQLSAAEPPGAQFPMSSAQRLAEKHAPHRHAAESSRQSTSMPASTSQDS